MRAYDNDENTSKNEREILFKRLKVILTSCWGDFPIKIYSNNQQQIFTFIKILQNL